MESIVISVPCISCGEDVKKEIYFANLSDKNVLPIFLFEGEEFHCSCGETTCTGDLECISIKDV